MGWHRCSSSVLQNLDRWNLLETVAENRLTTSTGHGGATLLEDYQIPWLATCSTTTRQSVVSLGITHAGPLAKHRIGIRNALVVGNIARRHRAVAEIVAGLICILAVDEYGADQLPDDSNMPRVQGPKFGASERIAVAHGDEEHGYFELPGGQSGHPLSTLYGAGHSDRVEGKPTPFPPGPARHAFRFEPPEVK